MTTGPLAETLEMLAQAAQDADDEWWVIGSAAVALHGAEGAGINDVDVMMSARDAAAFLHRVGAVEQIPATSALFRSQVFGVWSEPPVPVEVFGGFELAENGQWREVKIFTRESAVVRSGRVFVPAANELVRLLHAFGRAKDLERASLLEV